MYRLFFVLVLTVVAVTCSSGDAEPEATSTSTPLAEPILTVDDEFTFTFPEGVWEEKPFPAALLDTSNPLSHEQAAEVWTEFINNSMIVDELQGQPFLANAYCSSGIFETHYSELPGLVGQENEWEVIAAPGTDWNSSNLSLFLGEEVLSLPIPSGGTMPSWIESLFGTDITRVYDFPECAATFGTLRQLPSEIFELMGVDEVRPFPPETGPDSAALPGDEIVRIWTEYMANTLTWSDALRRPESMHCEDGTAMALGQGFPEEIWGTAFEWRIAPGNLDGEKEKYGSDLLNAGILEQDFGPAAPVGIYGYQDTNPRNGYRTIHPDITNTPLFEVDFPTCSVEVGLELLERFAGE